MSGSRPQHLQRRAGTYHLRVRVPDDVRARVGLLEVRRSLHVHTLAEARPLALALAARVLEIFEMIRHTTLTKPEARALIDVCFSDLHREADPGFVAQTDSPDSEIDEQRALAWDRIVGLNGQIERDTYSGDVRRTAARLAADHGFSPKAQPSWVRTDLMQGVARAIIEQQRLVLYRLEERLLPFEPQDPLFAGFEARVIDHAMQGAVMIVPVAGNAAPGLSAPIGPTIGELAEKYLSVKKGSWASKTYLSRQRQVGYLVEFLGADKRASSVTPSDVKDLRDALCRLRANHHVGAGKSFTSRQTDNLNDRIAGKTADLLFETCKAFFRWAKGDTYIAANPADGIPNAVHPKAKSKVRSRRPFSQPELATLFGSPVFTGCKSLRQRHETGQHVFSDAKYWVPLLGYFTGMRMGEIVQLQFDDVRIGGPIPYLNVTEEGGGEEGSGQEKYVKSDAGARLVPLHPDLIALGFREFVERRKKQRKGNGRLFFEVGYGADGMPSTRFSKWFGRLLGKAGLDDPALVFHSFRHNAQDAFKNANVQQYVTDKIIGHADGATSSGYGEGAELENCYEAVKAMKLKIDLVGLLAEHRPPHL